MGKCLKGESSVSQKNVKFTCEKCGAGVEESCQVCKPQEVKPDKSDKKEKKDKQGKKDKKAKKEIKKTKKRLKLAKKQ